MDQSEKKALEDIAQYGCHILHVLEENDRPGFSYSIGIENTSAQPEIVVTGLPREAAHEIINEYNRLVRAGKVFTADTMYSEFLEGYESTFKIVDKQYYKEYFGWALWLYKGEAFEVLHFIFPSKSGDWPWDESASTDYSWFLPKLYRN